MVLFAVSSVRAQNAPQSTLPTVTLSAGIHLIHAEVAATSSQRSVGLMMRQTMSPNGGMLFLFDQPEKQCMWMRNTLLPLSVAFLDDDGTVVNIEDMQPRTEDIHCSTKPVRYALETHQGWFSRRGLKAGAKIGGLPK
ncbi:MAG TPA: DUF192 domain-containing protein [Burkholderiaceae bacterium]|nr:DUF192 domain-containing protein [Burkholderiaceae bacterium]